MGAVGKTYGFVPPEGARKYLSVISRGAVEDDAVTKRGAETEDVKLQKTDVDHKKRKSDRAFSSEDLNNFKIQTSQDSNTSKET